MAADALLSLRPAQGGYGTFRMLIVTDGQAGDPDLVERFTPDILSRGIIVDAIGVDMKEKHTLATKVHSYRRANEAAQLDKALEEVVGELGSKAIDDVGAFEIIRPLPDDLAMPVLAAFTTRRDQPVGVRATDAPRVEDPGARGTAPGAAPPPASPSPPPAPGAPSGRSGSSRIVWIMVAFVAIIVISAIRKAAKGMSR